MSKRKNKDTPEPTPKKWASPGIAKNGDSDIDITYAAVGRALSKWESVENELARIFEALVGHGISVEAYRSYGSILTNSGRLALINAAAEAFFFTRKSDDDLRLFKNLTDLLSDVKDLSARRNEIAHGYVTLIMGQDLDDFTDATYILGPSYYSERKRKLTTLRNTTTTAMISVYEYSSREINLIAEWFQELRRPASMISHAVRRRCHLERQALLQKSASQPGGQ